MEKVKVLDIENDGLNMATDGQYLYIQCKRSMYKYMETACVAKKAVKGMTRILGFYNDSLVIADGGISLWDMPTLELHNRFDFPTGHFNKGVLLHDDLLIGSDYQSLYWCTL